MAKQVKPIFSIPVSTSVTSLCFTALARNSNTSSSETEFHEDNEDSDEGSSSDDDSFEGFQFRSAQLLKQRQELHNFDTFLGPQTLAKQSLASCHSDGTLRLWDLNQRAPVSVMPFEGPGLAVRRLSSASVLDTGREQSISPLLLYHTRDPNGTVSIIDLTQTKVIQEFQTRSQNFCEAAPCYGDDNLLALPSESDSTVTIMDRRNQRPAYVLPMKDKGMLTSLSMGVAGDKPVLVCGMENGSVLFHHLAMDRQKYELNLSKDPVLAVDMTISPPQSSMVVAAGMAGDAAEVSELPPDQQGRVALIKAIHDDSSTNQPWNVKLRARMATCKVDETSYGKPGVSICRFRPGDGRLLAVGGWDRRSRIFDRSTGKPMAILRGHEGSMNSLDWAPNSTQSGLFASAGADDNHIHIWKIFGR